MKELELEDKQYEVDKELNELCQVSRKLLLRSFYLVIKEPSHRPSNVKVATQEIRGAL